MLCANTGNMRVQKFRLRKRQPNHPPVYVFLLARFGPENIGLRGDRRRQHISFFAAKAIPPNRQLQLRVTVNSKRVFRRGYETELPLSC